VNHSASAIIDPLAACGRPRTVERRGRRLPQLRLAHCWLCLPALLAFIYVATQCEYQLDFWHQVTTGRWTWQNGAFCERDTFTFTIENRPFINQNWLMQCALYLPLEIGGFELAQFLAALNYAAVFALVTCLALHRCGNPRIAAAVTLVSLTLALSNLAVRTQALSILLFAAELLALWRYPRHAWTIGVVALVELLWTNSHGAFALGVILPGIFFIDRSARMWFSEGVRAVVRDRLARQYLASVVVAAGVMFCNPHPAETLDYIFGVVNKATDRGIGEWLPPTMATFTGRAFFISLVFACLALNLSGRRIELLEAILLATFVLLGAGASRMVIWWSIVMAPLLAPHVAAAWARFRPAGPTEPERPLVNYVVAALLITVAILSTPWTRGANPLLNPAKRLAVPAQEPRQLVEFLRKRGYTGRCYNPMEWGAYITYCLDPQVKVFIDGRVDFFPDDVWQKYEDVWRLHQDRARILDSYHVNLVIWSRRFVSDLPAALEQSDEWRLVYRDEVGVVFARNQQDSLSRSDLREKRGGSLVDSPVMVATP